MNKNNDIVSVINILRTEKFYGGGDNIEIAKGKNQIVFSWSELKEKIKRIIKAKK